jgi:hypothetical protein
MQHHVGTHRLGDFAVGNVLSARGVNSRVFTGKHAASSKVFAVKVYMRMRGGEIADDRAFKLEKSLLLSNDRLDRYAMNLIEFLASPVLRPPLRL